MNYNLMRAAEEYAAGLKKHGIKVDPENCVIVTRDRAMQLDRNIQNDKARKIVRDAVNEAEEAYKKKQQSKQTTLFN